MKTSNAPKTDAYLLDTNVISEFTKKEPHPAVINWFQQYQTEPIYLSVITLGEIQQGIARLPISKRQQELNHWLNDVLLVNFVEFFQGHN